MDSEQNDSGSFWRPPALNGDLPKVPVERRHNARLGFREIRTGAQNVVAIVSERLSDRHRKIPIGEEAHLRWSRERLVFVGERAGVQQTGEDVLSCQVGVVW